MAHLRRRVVSSLKDGPDPHQAFTEEIRRQNEAIIRSYRRTPYFHTESEWTVLQDIFGENIVNYTTKIHPSKDDPTLAKESPAIHKVGAHSIIKTIDWIYRITLKNMIQNTVGGVLLVGSQWHEHAMMKQANPNLFSVIAFNDARDIQRRNEGLLQAMKEVHVKGPLAQSAQNYIKFCNGEEQDYLEFLHPESDLPRVALVLFINSIYDMNDNIVQHYVHKTHCLQAFATYISAAKCREKSVYTNEKLQIEWTKTRRIRPVTRKLQKQIIQNQYYPDYLQSYLKKELVKHNLEIDLTQSPEKILKDIEDQAYAHKLEAAGDSKWKKFKLEVNRLLASSYVLVPCYEMRFLAAECNGYVHERGWIDKLEERLYLHYESGPDIIMEKLEDRADYILLKMTPTDVKIASMISTQREDFSDLIRIFDPLEYFKTSTKKFYYVRRTFLRQAITFFEKLNPQTSTTPIINSWKAGKKTPVVLVHDLAFQIPWEEEIVEERITIAFAFYLAVMRNHWLQEVIKNAIENKDKKITGFLMSKINKLKKRWNEWWDNHNKMIKEMEDCFLPEKHIIKTEEFYNSNIPEDLLCQHWIGTEFTEVKRVTFANTTSHSGEERVVQMGVAEQNNEEDMAEDAKQISAAQLLLDKSIAKQELEDFKAEAASTSSTSSQRSRKKKKKKDYYEGNFSRANVLAIQNPEKQVEQHENVNKMPLPDSESIAKTEFEPAQPDMTDDFSLCDNSDANTISPVERKPKKEKQPEKQPEKEPEKPAVKKAEDAEVKKIIDAHIQEQSEGIAKYVKWIFKRGHFVSQQQVETAVGMNTLQNLPKLPERTDHHDAIRLEWNHYQCKEKLEQKSLCLEVGCGQSESKRIDKNMIWHSIDLAEKTTATIKGDFLKHLFQDKYDMIVCRHSVHHIGNLFFMKAEAILKPGGFLLIIDEEVDPSDAANMMYSQLVHNTYNDHSTLHHMPLATMIGHCQTMKLQYLNSRMWTKEYSVSNYSLLVQKPKNVDGNKIEKDEPASTSQPTKTFEEMNKSETATHPSTESEEQSDGSQAHEKNNCNNEPVVASTVMTNSKFRSIRSLQFEKGIKANIKELTVDVHDCGKAIMGNANAMKDNKLKAVLKTAGTNMLNTPITNPDKWTYALIMGVPGSKKSVSAGTMARIHAKTPHNVLYIGHSKIRVQAEKRKHPEWTCVTQHKAFGLKEWFDVVIIDECQSYEFGLTIALMNKFQKAKIILTGDVLQAGWFLDYNKLVKNEHRLIKKFHIFENRYYLTKTYRFSENICKLLRETFGVPIVASKKVTHETMLTTSDLKGAIPDGVFVTFSRTTAGSSQLLHIVTDPEDHTKEISRSGALVDLFNYKGHLMTAKVATGLTEKHVNLLCDRNDIEWIRRNRPDELCVVAFSRQTHWLNIVALDGDPRHIADKLRLKGTQFTAIEINATNFVKDIQPSFNPVVIENRKIETEHLDSKGLKTYQLKK